MVLLEPPLQNKGNLMELWPQRTPATARTSVNQEEEGE